MRKVYLFLILAICSVILVISFFVYSYHRILNCDEILGNNKDYCQKCLDGVTDLTSCACCENFEDSKMTDDKSNQNIPIFCKKKFPIAISWELFDGTNRNKVYQYFFEDLAGIYTLTVDNDSDGKLIEKNIYLYDKGEDIETYYYHIGNVNNKVLTNSVHGFHGGANVNGYGFGFSLLTPFPLNQPDGTFTSESLEYENYHPNPKLEWGGGFPNGEFFDLSVKKEIDGIPCYSGRTGSYCVNKEHCFDFGLLESKDFNLQISNIQENTFTKDFIIDVVHEVSGL